jgi:beta-glucanase (GH16 family)
LHYNEGFKILKWPWILVFFSGLTLKPLNQNNMRYPFLFAFLFLNSFLTFGQANLISMRGKQYQLLFNDDFSAPTVDTTKWNFRSDGKHWSQQVAKNVVQKNGNLELQLKKETSGIYSYTGAGLISKAGFDYGYYESRIKLPPGDGWHSAFWLMTHDGSGGTGPSQTKLEVDILENDSRINYGYLVDLHKWYDPYINFGGKYIPAEPLKTDYQTFGCLFDIDSVFYFYNGALVDKRSLIGLETSKMNIWLTCIASFLGGTTAVDDSKLPSAMLVDYVRFYGLPPTPPAVSISLLPSADTYVQGGTNASRNYGTAQVLSTKKSTDLNYSRETLLRFDISSFSSQVDSAKLRIFAGLSDTKNPSILTQIKEIPSTNVWTETTTTWNNRPAEAGLVLGSCTIAGTTKRYYEWNLTEYVKAQKAAGKTILNLKLFNSTNTSSRIDFNSKEAIANKPILFLRPAIANPVILTQPQNQSIPQGEKATFFVVATGPQTLFYQWRKNSINISGANSNTLTINQVALADAGAYSVVVGYGPGTPSITSSAAQLSVNPPNQKPKATIITPVSGATYAGGDVLAFSGSGTDPEDGSLAASGFTWWIQFNKSGQFSTVLPPFSGFSSAQYIVPNTGELSTQVFYRIYLVVADAQGKKDTTFRDVIPRLSSLTLQTIPAGMNIGIDGQTFSAPYTLTGVQGMIRNIYAPSPQGGFAFSVWSQGGSQSQNIVFPSTPGTWSAVFLPASSIILHPMADTYVQSGTSSALNFGSAPTFSSKASTDILWIREGLIRFDISSVAMGIGSAKLQMYGGLSDNWNPTVQVDLKEIPSGNSWQELNVTWDTRPMESPPVISSQTIVGFPKKYYDWDLTSYLISKKAAGINIINLKMINPVVTASRVDFNSKEAGSNIPQLVITGNTGSRLGFPDEKLKGPMSEPPSFFPNPTEGLMYCKTSSNQISISTIQGKDITHEIQIEDLAEAKTLDLSGLPNGIYLVRIESKTYRIMKAGN